MKTSVLLLALLVLVLVACSPGSTYTAPPAQQVVVEVTRVVAPTAKPILPTPRPVQDDMDVFAGKAKALGLVFDGKKYCAAGSQTDGAWYANYAGAYNFCFAVTNGRTSSLGGFVDVDGDTQGFGEDLAILAMQMGYPLDLLDALADSLSAFDLGDHAYRNYKYSIQTDDDYSTLFVTLYGTP